MKTKNEISGYVIFLVGCVCILFSNGRFNVPVLAWIWPAALLFSFRRFQNKLGIISASLFFILLQSFRYFGYSGAGYGADLLYGSLIGLTILIPLLLDRKLYPWLTEKLGFFAVFFAPLTFLSACFCFEIFASVPLIAYTQYGFLPLMQTVSVIGSYGLSFLIFLFATVVLYFTDNFRTPKKAVPVLSVYLAVMLTLIFVGQARLSGKTEESRSVLIATALTPSVGEYTEGTFIEAGYDENIAFLSNKAAEAHSRGAEILCFAEEAFAFNDNELDTYLDKAAEIAKENEIYILFTADIADTDGDCGGKRQNTEFLFSPDGDVLVQYTKVNLLPGVMEANEYIAGEGKPLFAEITLDGGKTLCLSSVICFDANNASFVASSDERTQILLVPSWTWKGCAGYQAHMMPLRAIENGFSLVCPTISGITCSFDGYGRTVFKKSEAEIGRETLTVIEVPLNDIAGNTAYHAVAEWIDYLYPIFLMILLSAALIRHYFKKEK